MACTSSTTDQTRELGTTHLSSYLIVSVLKIIIKKHNRNYGDQTCEGFGQGKFGVVKSQAWKLERGWFN
jgi:hypothetical protein